MIAPFAELLERLPLAKGAGARQRLLLGFLDCSKSEDRGRGLAALLGASQLPRLSGKVLRELAAARLDADYFAISHDHVGDLAETIALLWPGQTGSDLAIAEIIADWQAAAPDARSELAASWLDRLDDDGRRALLAVLGGKAKVIESNEVRSALAAWGEVPLGEIESCWAAQAPPYGALFDWLEGAGPRPPVATDGYRPQARPTFVPFEEITPVSSDASVYWHWSDTGLPVQLICEEHGVRLYAEGGDDIGRQFPELLPAGGVPAFARGDLLVHDEAGLPSRAALQRRLRRTKVDAKLREALPARLYLHDWSSGDWLARQGNFPLSAAPVCVDLSRARELAPPGADAVLLISDDSESWRAAPLPPLRLTAALLYVEAGDDGYTCTIGLLNEGELVPVGKAVYSPEGEAAKMFAAWVKQNTEERFGPVRKVPATPVSISYRASERAPRRRAGLTLLGAWIETLLWDQEPDQVAGTAYIVK